MDINWDSVIQNAVIGGIIGGGVGLLYVIGRAAIRWMKTGSPRDKK